MPETFPPGLDDCFLVSGFTQQNKPVLIRSEVDVGLPKVRRRYTRPFQLVTGSIKADKNQVNTFNTFFDTTLQGGLLWFEFNDPFTGSLASYRFIDPPVITPITEKWFLISMNLEKK